MLSGMRNILEVSNDLFLNYFLIHFFLIYAIKLNPIFNF